MDKLGAEELRKVVESLVQTTKCAVCLNVLQLDTVVCVSGHVFCRGCRRLQTSCPTCRKEFSNVENSAFVRQVLEVIPHTCPNKGCPEVVYRGDDHEKYCKYRIIQCRCSTCHWQGFVKDLVQHGKSEHTGSSCFTTLSSVTVHDFHVRKEKNCEVLFDTYGHMFFIKGEYKPSTGMMSFAVYPVLTAKPPQEIFFKVTFDSPEKRTMFVTKIDLGAEDESHDKNIINVPVADLLPYWEESSNKLKYLPSITKTK